jgi:hypothetical protein
MPKTPLIRPANRDRLVLAAKSFLTTLAMLAVIGLVALVGRVFFSSAPLPTLPDLTLLILGGVVLAGVVTAWETAPLWGDRISVKPKREVR